MKVDGISITAEGDPIVVTGYYNRDNDTSMVTSAGLLGNATPGKSWRAQDGWEYRTVTLTPDDARAIDAITDTFGRLFHIAEILATRGTPQGDPSE